MNPRQRRGVILLALAVVAGLGVFFSVLAFVSDVNAKVGDLVTVVQVDKPVPAYTVVTPDMLVLKDVPRKWLPSSAITDTRDVVGLVPTTDLPGGIYAQRGMFVDRPGIQAGYREIAILVDAETSVAGKVASGDRVDIITTQDDDERKVRSSQILVSNALIIDVGVPETVEKAEESGFSSGKAVPVTFALPISSALKVAYAESFATKVRLALRGGGDQAPVPNGKRSFVVKGAS